MNKVPLGPNIYLLPPTARDKSPQVTLSTAERTIALSTVELSQHTVVLRITITPFKSKSHPGQVFFPVAIHYFECCALAAAVYKESIKQRTESVLQTFFPNINCDLKEPSWLVLRNSSSCAPLIFPSFQAGTYQISTPVESCYQRAQLTLNHLTHHPINALETSMFYAQPACDSRRLIS